MDKKTARKVVQNLNHPKIMDAIEDYVEYRISKLREQLETVKDLNLIYELQGSIKELRTLRKIRETALAVDSLKES